MLLSVFSLSSTLLDIRILWNVKTERCWLWYRCWSHSKLSTIKTLITIYALAAVKRGCKHDSRTKETSNCARLSTCCTGTSTALISMLVVNNGGWRPSFQRQHICMSGSSYACPTVRLSMCLKQASQMQICSGNKLIVARARSSPIQVLNELWSTIWGTLRNQIR